MVTTLEGADQEVEEWAREVQREEVNFLFFSSSCLETDERVFLCQVEEEEIEVEEAEVDLGGERRGEREGEEEVEIRKNRCFVRSEKIPFFCSFFSIVSTVNTTSRTSLPLQCKIVPFFSKEDLRATCETFSRRMLLGTDGYLQTRERKDYGRRHLYVKTTFMQRRIGSKH